MLHFCDCPNYSDIFLEPVKPRPVMTLLFNEMLLLILNHYYSSCI